MDIVTENKKMFPRICSVCGKTFYTEGPRRPKYCSDACRNAKIIKNEHVGEKFGKLTIVSDFQQNGRRYAECKCECGGNKTTLYKSLKRGDTTSCGCVKLKDVSGRVNAYGVKLIRRTRKAERREWKCLCKCPACGKEYEIRLNKFDRTQSCGCVASQRAAQIMKDGWNNVTSKGLVDNTQVFLMLDKKKSRRNTSGTSGVSYNKANNRWMAYIGFQHKLTYLGSYLNIEDAIAARKEAEEKIYGGFIEEFKKNHPDRWKIVEESHERNRKKER